MLREGTITYKFSDSTSSNVSENIVSISFRDQYGDMSQPPFYQFRWNQGLHGDELPTVADVLSQTAKRSIDHSDPAAESVCDLLNKPIVILSSGEFRRFQIARAIINRPTLLILDNPLIGLDYVNR
jgi:molybdate transport system ATP-binding protein